MKNNIFLTIIFISAFSYSQEINFVAHTIIDASTKTDRASSISTADFDGDGDLDVLGSSYWDDKIFWYQNEGDEQLSKQQLITDQANGVRNAVPVDIDNDGDIDIVASLQLDNKVVLYKNIDGENFEEQALSLSQEQIFVVYSVDLDNDNDYDLVFGSPGEVSWSENIDGAGNFSEKKIISAGGFVRSAIFFADIDGDTYIDIIESTSGFSSTVKWYRNNSDLKEFDSSIVINADARGVSSLYMDDIDNDGDNDLILTSVIDYEIIWYENLDGMGNFSGQNVISSDFVNAGTVRLDDIDGDNDLDVVAGSESSSKLAWFENVDGNGNFSIKHEVTNRSVRVRSIFSADFDEDNDLDLFYASYEDSNLIWHENLNGNGDFGPEIMISRDAENVKSVFTVDIDGDGDNDVISGSNDQRIAWYENLDGDGSFGLQKVIISGLQTVNFVHAEDIDADGDYDIIAEIAGYPGNKIIWLENLDGKGNFSQEKTIEEGIEAVINISVSDLDNDSDFDIIVSSSQEKIIAWYENTDGKGNFSSRQVILSDINRPLAMSICDINNDSHLDIVYGNNLYDNDGFYWIKNQGGADSFEEPSKISRFADHTNYVICSDIDNDGDFDVFGVAPNILLYKNVDGNGSFGFKINVSSFANVEQVISVDVDLDGDLDVVESSTRDDRIAWYENLDGTGENMSDVKLILGDIDFITSMATSDIDNDGDMDFVISSQYEDKIYWIENKAEETTLSVDQYQYDTISLFPIPTNEMVSIINPNKLEIDKAVIYSLDGTVVLEQNQKLSSINVSRLPKGMYVVKIHSGNNKMVKKIIKM
ncbi:T9SS type A sorting domain-containing protein [uncultured Aquimarina sp.]|uniref:T9SS type A sorting domain-containing protein n=1 Tax=uncultured Aquimarina sp. TaxID=575652 RepID=UPI00260D8915|nr:T9SS type A sorting domain-containing protein [uncultured Aquimarina sp.]